MTLEEFLGTALSILALAGLAGGLAGIFASNRRKEMDRINTQERADLKNRVETLTDEVGRLQAREGDCQRQLANQQQQINTLRELVTQTAKVDELIQSTREHHDEVREMLEVIQSADQVLLQRTKSL